MEIPPFRKGKMERGAGAAVAANPGQQWHECLSEHHNPLTGELLVLHIIPCCAKCQICSMNITGDMEAHLRDMHPLPMGPSG